MDKPFLQLIYDELKNSEKIRNQTDFADHLEYNKGQISRLLRSTEQLPYKLRDLLNRKFGFGKDWLSSNGASGKMYETRGKAVKEEQHPEKNARRVPVIGEALAGTDMELNVTDSTYMDEYIDVGDLLKDSEAAFTVYGNSMTPAYPSGCVLGIKRNYDNFIQPGETYLLVTRSNRIFKRLYWNEGQDGYVCFSDNTLMHEAGPMKGKFFYPPFEVLLKEVIGIYDVTGMIRRNRNSGIIMRQK